MTDRVRIWSFEHDAWWKSGGMGYTQHVQEAGIYLRDDAVKIVRQANICGQVNERIMELKPYTDFHRT